MDRERFDETLERKRSERASPEPRDRQRAAEPRRRPETASASSTPERSPQPSNAASTANTAATAQEQASHELTSLATEGSELETGTTGADSARPTRLASPGATDTGSSEAELGQDDGSVALRDLLQPAPADVSERPTESPAAPVAMATLPEQPEPSLAFEGGSAETLEPLAELEPLEPLAETPAEAPVVGATADSEPAPSASHGEDAGTPIAPRDATARTIEPTPEASAAKAAPAKEPPVSPERAADMLRQIRLQLSPGLRQAVIQLEPRELGRISIKVTMRGEACHAELRVEKRSALDALERQLPELEAALERAGLGGGELSLELDLERRESRDAAPMLPRALPSHASSAPAPRALTAALAGRIPASDGVDTYA